MENKVVEYVVRIGDEQYTTRIKPKIKELSKRFSDKTIYLIKGNILQNTSDYQVWKEGVLIKEELGTYCEQFLKFCKSCGIMYMEPDKDLCKICKDDSVL